MPLRELARVPPFAAWNNGGSNHVPRPDTELLKPFPTRDGSRNDRDARIRQRAYDLWWQKARRKVGSRITVYSEREIMTAEEPEASTGTPIARFKDNPPIHPPIPRASEVMLNPHCRRQARLQNRIRTRPEVDLLTATLLDQERQARRLDR